MMSSASSRTMCLTCWTGSELHGEGIGRKGALIERFARQREEMVMEDWEWERKVRKLERQIVEERLWFDQFHRKCVRQTWVTIIVLVTALILAVAA